MPHYRVRTNERGLSGGGPGVRRALSTADGPVGRNCGNKEGVGVSSHLYPYYINNEITTKIPKSFSLSIKVPMVAVQILSKEG